MTDSPAEYDAIADWYDAFVRAGSPIHALSVPALLALCGEVRGLRICDLGCGQGIVSRALAQSGASVAGIDLSQRLLAIAQAEEARGPRGIAYCREDAQNLAGLADATFDGVTCHLALMDFPDLDSSLRAVRRILRPNGWFVFAITHPCFQTPESRWTGKAGGTVRCEVRGYFREGYWRSANKGGVRGQVGAYHRSLSAYLNALSGAGFVLEAMREPQAVDEVSGRVPGYREVPVVLVARCRKSA